MSNIKIETMDDTSTTVATTGSTTPSRLAGVVGVVGGAVHNPSLSLVPAPPPIPMPMAAPTMSAPPHPHPHPHPHSHPHSHSVVVKQETYSSAPGGPVPVPLSTPPMGSTTTTTTMKPPSTSMAPPPPSSIPTSHHPSMHHHHPSAAPVTLGVPSLSADKAAVAAAARAVAMAPSVPRSSVSLPSRADGKPSKKSKKSNTTTTTTTNNNNNNNTNTTTNNSNHPVSPNAVAAPQVTTVTMATAATATPASTGQGSQGENTGRWTAEEHRLFLQGLEQHGKGWKKIASLIKSRTVVQIRTHAQKYFQKLAKARQNGDEGDISMEGRGGGGTAVGGMAGNSSLPQVNPASLPPPCVKRRRQASGTKRKAISSIVASAQAEGKRLATETNAATPPLPVVTPVLAPYVVPSPVHPHNPVSTTQPPPPQQQQQHTMHRISPPPIYNSMPASQAGVSGPALEDSLFRFLTPAANEPMPAPTSKPPQAPPSSSTTTNTAVTNNVNEVARQAGAPPIVVPTDHHRSLSANHHHHPPHHHAHHHSVSHPTTTTAMPNNNNNTSYNNYSGLLGGEGSPTGVNDIHNFPTWIDCEPPTWYTKGSDVDELLNEADALDWLADSGDLDETYKPPQPSTNNTTTTTTNHPPIMTSTTHPPHPTTNTKTTTMEPSLVSICDGTTTSTTTPQSPSLVSSSLVGNISSDQLPQKCDSVSNIPPLPSLFGSSQNMATVACQKVTTPNLSSASLFGSATDAVNGTSDGLAVFESHFDEQAFVSALLENNESTSNILGTALQ